MIASTAWSDLSAGEKAGVAVGAACGTLIVVALIALLLRRRGSSDRETISNGSAGSDLEPAGQQLAEYELRKWRRSVGMPEGGHDAE